MCSVQLMGQIIALVLANVTNIFTVVSGAVHFFFLLNFIQQFFFVLKCFLY